MQKGHEGSVSEAECEKGAVVSNTKTEKNKEKDTPRKAGSAAHILHAEQGIAI